MGHGGETLHVRVAVDHQLRHKRGVPENESVARSGRESHNSGPTREAAIGGRLPVATAGRVKIDGACTFEGPSFGSAGGSDV
jgi:hypothetical protein